MFQRIATLKMQGCGIIFGERYVMDQIMLTASGMLIDRREKAEIKNEICEGQMVTKLEYTSVGSLAGVEFFLWLDTDAGRVFLDFILARPISEDELRSTLWVNCPEGVDVETIMDALEKLFAKGHFTSPSH